MRCTPPTPRPQQRHSPTKDVKSNATTELLSVRGCQRANPLVVVATRQRQSRACGWAQPLAKWGCVRLCEELRLGEVVALEVPLPQSATLTVLESYAEPRDQYGFQFTALSAAGARAQVLSATSGRRPFLFRTQAI